MKIADLETMDRAALIAAWSRAFRTPVPKGLSRSFLRVFLANEMQKRLHGDLPKKVLSALMMVEVSPARPSCPGLKPGGRLLREWNGVTHVIEVGEGGFLWKGARYRSLSAIAREITGAHWSGPRFFALTRKPGA